MTEFYVDSLELTKALAAALPWHDPKTEIDSWNRIRAVQTGSHLWVLATNGTGAFAAATRATRSDGDDEPLVVDLTRHQAASIVFLFKPKKKPGDDEPMGEELRVTVTRADSSLIGGEVLDALQIVSAGGLFDGQEWQCDLGAVAEDFPRVMTALSSRLEASEPAVRPDVHLRGQTLALIAKTAAAIGARTVLERTGTSETGGSLVARFGTSAAVLLPEVRGDEEDLREIRSALVDQLQASLAAEPARSAPESSESEPATVSRSEFVDAYAGAVISLVDRARGKTTTTEKE